MAVLVATSPACTPRSIEPGDVPGDAVDASTVDANTSLTVFDVHVERNLAHDPLAGATVRIEWSDGRYDEAMTSAEGLATFHIDFARGPFDVTAWSPGFAASSVVAVRGALDSPIRLFAFADEGAVGSISGTISGRLDPAHTVLISGPELVEIAPQPDSFHVQRFVHPETSPRFRETSRLYGLEFDSTMDLVNIAISEPISGREVDVRNVTLQFPSPPRTIGVGMRSLQWPDRGIVSESSAPQWILGSTAHFESDRSLLWPLGFTRSSPVLAGRSNCRWQYGLGDPDILPSHVLVGYAMQARQPFTMYAAWPELDARDPLVVPTVLAFELVGTTLDAIRVNAAAESATALRLLVLESDTSQVVWMLNAYDPADAVAFHVPHLPRNATVSSITTRPLAASAIFGFSDPAPRTDFPGLPSPVELWIGPTPVEPGDR